MSLTEHVYATLMSHLQKFTSLKQDQKRILLRECYTYMGNNFMKALSILDYTQKKLTITDYPLYYILTYEKERFVLFKDKRTLVDNDIHKVFKFEIECSCEESWNRKTDKKAPFFCLHQILLYLIQATKHYDVPIQKGLTENMDDLGELLLFLK